MQRSLYLLLLVSTLCGGLGCSRNTVAVKRSSLSLQMALQSQETALRMLNKVAAQASQAAEAGRIATSANEEIQAYVSTERAKLEDGNQKLQTSLTSVQDYSTGKTKSSEAEVVKEANAAVTASTAVMRILEKKTEVIVDFLHSETFSKSEIGALFQPGEYELLTEQMKEGQRLFRPIVEKLFMFASKYKGTFRTLKGEIIVTGYSDATAVESGSRLYKDLVQRLQQTNQAMVPTSSDLNQKLSELRAYAVKGLLESIISSRKRITKEPLDITVNVLGRGEEIPRGLPVSLSANDRRRRVVTFYWVVLPGL